MWRSLFYAVGIALFSMGLQGLVLDHLLVPQNTKLQRLVKKVLSDDKPAGQTQVAAQPVGVAGGTAANQPPWNWTNQQPQQAAQPVAGQRQFPSYETAPNTGSRFGPSRFAGPRYGTGYGGARVGSAPQSGSAFGSFPYQNQGQPNAQLAGYRPSGTTTQPAQPGGPRQPIALQKLMVREWMPWSLLASGAIIFLYTHTLHRRRSHE